MNTDLMRICPDTVFTSLYHHVTDIDNLKECLKTLYGRKAVGVDSMTKSSYGANLDENCRDLAERLRRMGYRPQPKRRKYDEKSTIYFNTC